MGDTSQPTYRNAQSSNLCLGHSEVVGHTGVRKESCSFLYLGVRVPSSEIGEKYGMLCQSTGIDDS